MKIICLECHRELREESPFDDPGEIHTVCPQCLQRAVRRAAEGDPRGEPVGTARMEMRLELSLKVDTPEWKDQGHGKGPAEEGEPSTRDEMAEWLTDGWELERR
ncbi:MAG: hypothetical protein JRJ26_16015 [Deltaproteobacteria bacterium]|nr:hypothetical protein [Deltaproteobacteria bacterium]